MQDPMRGRVHDVADQVSRSWQPHSQRSGRPQRIAATEHFRCDFATASHCLYSEKAELADIGEHRRYFASSGESVRDSQSAWVYIRGFRNPKDSSWYERCGPYILQTRPEEDLEMPTCLSMCSWVKEGVERRVLPDGGEREPEGLM